MTTKNKGYISEKQEFSGKGSRKQPKFKSKDFKSAGRKGGNERRRTLSQ